MELTDIFITADLNAQKASQCLHKCLRWSNARQKASDVSDYAVALSISQGVIC